MPLSSIRSPNCKDGGSFEPRARPTKYSFTTGRSSAPLPWVYLGYPFSDTLSRELKRIEAEAIYQKRVFFIQNLGVITPTEARRISFEESLRFRTSARRDLSQLWL
jgi:hypothetical protein